jgi:hypothetical protein
MAFQAIVIPSAPSKQALWEIQILPEHRTQTNFKWETIRHFVLINFVSSDEEPPTTIEETPEGGICIRFHPSRENERQLCHVLGWLAAPRSYMS